MRYLSLFFGVIFFSLSLTSCQTTKKTKKNFDAYLPHVFEDYFSDYIPLKEVQTIDDSVWDVSNVDISYVDKNRKLIAFTFDDSPSKTLENILAAFTSFNESNPDCRATATVFYNGSLIDETSLHLLHTSYILGFELGNHTHSHFDLTTLSESELTAEINQTDEILSQVDGKKRHLLRAPFGRVNEDIKTKVNVPLIDWTIDTLDWTGASADDVYNRVWKGKFSGAIVLMHDGYPHTVDALKRLLPDLKADGYQVVSVSAMAKAHGCTLKNGKVYIRARKQ